MKYIVTRTSIWGDKKPCEEAFEEEVVCTYFENGKKVVWMIEINTLEELHEFIDKYGGSVVIEDWYFNNAYKKIEIYDDYRE